MTGFARPQYLKVIPENISAEMREYRAFVNWRGEPRDEKFTKCPYQPNGWKASSTNEETWRTLDEVLRAYQSPPPSVASFDGIGFSLEKTPFAAVDVDNCVTDGEPNEWGRKVLALFPGAYKELSPSGNGLRIIVRGSVPAAVNDRKTGTEMYDSGRYVTLTGHTLPGSSSTIADGTAGLRELYGLLRPPKPDRPKPERSGLGTGLSDDNDVLSLAFRAKNGEKTRALYNGDTTGFASASEAVASLAFRLAFFTGNDPVQLERLMRSSNLYTEKWDEPRGAHAWIELEVLSAIEGQSEFYSPPGSRGQGKREATTDNGADTTATPPPGPDSWDGIEPGPLEVDLLSVPAFDYGLLPDALSPWVKDIAERGCFSPEFVAIAAITALSAVVGRQVGIRPKRYDDWQVNPNLWGGAVGLPGTLKTPAVAEALKPLYRLEAEARELYETQKETWKESCAIAEARQKAAKTQLTDAVKKPGTPENRLRELAREAAGTDAEPEPMCRRYLVNDTSVEKLGELLRENPNGLMLHRDELTGFFKTLDRQGHEGDRAFYLEAWNGSGAFTYDRIGRGTVHIPAVCVSVFGTIQPGPLASYLRRAGSGEEADGFMSRLQLLVWPDPPKRYRAVDRWPSQEAKDTAWYVFLRLAHIDTESIGAQVDEDDSGSSRQRAVPYLHFDVAAQAAFDAWREKLENRLLAGRDSPLMLMHLSKYRSLLPSLALIFHLADRGMGPVPLAQVERAIAWCAFLEAHARRLYQYAMDGDPQVAVRLAERFKEASFPNPFTARYVYRKNWTGLQTVEEVERACNLLEDRGWLQAVEDRSSREDGKGRPSVKYYIHPALMQIREGDE